VVQDVTTLGREIDEPLRDALIEEIGKERYQLWFGAKTRLSYHAKVLTCNAANAFYQDWLRANFRSALERAAASAVG